MPTEKPRITITMSEDQLAQIEAYKFENKIKNQTQAILALIEKGMDVLEAQDSEAIKNAFDADLPTPKAEGKNNIQLFSDMLTRAGLIKDGGDISDDDADFLQAMLLALKAHFKQRKKNRD